MSLIQHQAKPCQSQRKRYYHLLVIIICFFSISYYLWEPNLRAQWWAIDDHLIMWALGSDGKISFSEIPAKLMETEVGVWGKNLRYRPSYWELKLLECWIWGKNPSFWYLFRIGIFFLFLVILLYLVSQMMGLFYSSIFVCFVVLLPLWKDIFTRLGPSETYAVLGTSLYALGFFNYWKEIRQSIQKSRAYANIQIIVMSCGAIIAIGSKENFVLLMLPALFLVIYAFIHKKARAWLVIASALIIEYALFIALGIFLAISKSGKDFYMQDVDAQSHINILIRHIPDIIRVFRLFYIYPIFILLGVLIFAYHSDKKDDYIKYIRQYTIITLLLTGLYLSQMIFYHGQWPAGNRYDFPGVLTIPFFYLFTILTAVNILYLLNVPKRIIDGIVVCTIILFYLASPYQLDELSKMRQASWHNVERTVTFTNNIHSIVREVKDNPEIPLIFESFDVLDYEPIFSVRWFLLANGLQNPMYLYTHPYPQDPLDHPLVGQLARNLALLHKYGGEGFLAIGPLRVQDNSCFVVSFSGDNTTPCPTLRIWN